MTIRLRLAAALLAGFALLFAGAAAPAGAHEGDAVIEIEQTHPSGTSVHYIVRVTWENDGHPAADATVTATGVVASGEQLTPVTLDPVDDDGRYAGVVEYPGRGSYTVRITSIDPTGTVERSETVTASASTQPPDVTAPSEVTTGTAEAGDGGFAPEDDGTGASDDGTDEQAAAGDDGDDGMPAWLIAVAAVVAIGGAVSALRVIRRYRRPGGPGGSDGGDGGAGGNRRNGGDGGESDPRVEAGSAGTDRP